MDAQQFTDVVEFKKPFWGFGLGLRPTHYSEILETNPRVDWFEIITENYLVPGGKPLYYLDAIRSRYPIAMHGVSLSIGSTDPIDKNYLQSVKALVKQVQPMWVSDHLCWTGVHGKNMHDLLPLPYTEETIRHVSSRIQQVQDFLGQRILIENVSSYIEYNASTMPEWVFLSAIAQEADCLLLLDINNIYVSARNHHFDPLEYMHHIPKERVYQHHIAGHSYHKDFIIDTHDMPVIPDVWKLYEEAVKTFGLVSTMIERDDNIPPLATLIEELDTARSIASRVHADHAEVALC